MLTYTIVTGPPGLVSGDIHDRAPVILPGSRWEQWLMGTPNDAAVILAGCSKPELAYHAVLRDVGSPKNDYSDLVLPLAGLVCDLRRR